MWDWVYKSTSHEVDPNCPSKKWSICVNVSQLGETIN